MVGVKCFAMSKESRQTQMCDSVCHFDPSAHSHRAFSSDEWESRWINSEHSKDNGKFILSAGKYFTDKEEDKGEWLA